MTRRNGFVTDGIEERRSPRLVVLMVGVAAGVLLLVVLALRAWPGADVDLAAGGANVSVGTAVPVDAPVPGSAAPAVRQVTSEGERLGEIPADRWIGAADGGLSGEDLRGQVVLVEFWTYLCYNCKNVEPWMKETHKTYSGRGLRVIGVHTPEFDVEKKLENVVAYVKENEIEYPVAIDNGFRVWRKYNSTNAWPAFLVFDREGELIYRRAGERAVHGAREAIEKALAEGSPEASASAPRGRSTGVVVRAASVRTSPGSASLEIGFEPIPGFLLVKSPPNEVRLDLPDGVTTPSNPATLGEPFQGGDSRSVQYFEGPARVAIPLEISGPLASRSVDVRGTIVYHVCDKKTNVCARHEAPLAETVGAL